MGVGLGQRFAAFAYLSCSRVSSGPFPRASTATYIRSTRLSQLRPRRPSHEGLMLKMFERDITAITRCMSFEAQHILTWCRKILKPRDATATRLETSDQIVVVLGVFRYLFSKPIRGHKYIHVSGPPVMCQAMGLWAHVH